MKPAKTPVYVTPALAGRLSMTVDEAKKLQSHPHAAEIPKWLMDEAQAVVKLGQHWWQGK